MPSYLTKHDAVYFICARNFTFAGKDYSMGEEFPQEESMGRIDLLVRTRRLFAVVDDPKDKPRHWHHHVWTRDIIDEKLGINSETSSGYNKPKQNDLTFASVETDKAKKWEDQDVAADLKAEATANALTEQVLDDENAAELDDGCVGEHHPTTNPDCDMAPAEPQNATGTAEDAEYTHGEAVEDDDGNVVVGELHEDEDDDDEDEVAEEDLYDPSEHSVAEVMEYLTGDISDTEYQRVVAVERTGKNRKGIVDNA